MSDRKLSRQVLLLVSLFAAAWGCRGPSVRIDGVQIEASLWQRARAQVTRRAAFELDCPRAELDLYLIRKVGRRPTEVGVTGCGQREVYNRVGGSWFSSRQPHAAAAEQRRLEQLPRSRQHVTPGARQK